MIIRSMKSLTLTHEGLEFGFAKFSFIGLCAQTFFGGGLAWIRPTRIFFTG